MNQSPFGPEKDNFYMQQALKQAARAYAQQEVPVGAVLVNNAGVIIARGYNSIEKMKSQSAHAEIRALQKATQKNKDWRLDGCWLYVTLEPCAMCMGLSALSRIEGVVFAARSPHFGYRLDKNNAVRVYKRDAVLVVEGVHALESAELLRKFFKKQREKA